MKCCNQEVNVTTLENNQVGLWCSMCGRKGSGQDKDDAFNNLLQSPSVPIPLPSNPNELPQYAARKINDLANISMAFVANDKPAFKKLISKNIRYITSLKDKKFLECWNTQEGQESIVYALEEAFALGASLPEMGCMVPFGGIAEFIPAVEAYEFALTNGSKPPFEWIQIDSIYKNDISKISIKNGEYDVELTPGSPRGELIQIVVYGKNTKLNKIIGEVFDKERLLEKAKNHSVSYKYFISNKAEFEQLKSEGKIKAENGREFFNKKMFKKGGGSWDKKVYLDEITNPYEGADQPEMLRKSAGKSFLKKFVRVRNSEAAINEINENDDIDDIIDKSMDNAFKIIPGNPEKKEEKKTVKNPAKKPKKEELFEEEPVGNNDLSLNLDDVKLDEIPGEGKDSKLKSMI